MDKVLEKYQKELLLLPVGGAGEIGMNLYLYHLDGKMIMVDCGIGFADDFLPGVDLTVPDVSFLKKHKNDILALIITHCHEDHLGAVPYVWQDIQCPIYASKFAASLLGYKLREAGILDRVNVKEVADGQVITLGSFEVEFVNLTHSTVEMHALFMRTRYGNIFHTGDWRFDDKPVIGEKVDRQRLASYGEEGVLAVIGDSTNIFDEEPARSEGELEPSLIEIIKSCSSLVIVTTFASNVSRIETIMRAAHACGRAVGLMGRSVVRTVQAAREVGYLVDLPSDRELTDVIKLPREKALIICTGCQGEEMAVTSKLATGTHPLLKLVPGDSIIFSSRIIPGNEKDIYRLFNQFVEKSIELFTVRDHFVHVSGHPGKSDLKELYGLLKPKILIPVHGERVHIHEHIRYAKTLGISSVVEVNNGTVAKISPGEPQVVAKLDMRSLAVDGNCLLTFDSKVMKDRRTIRRAGAIIAALVISEKGFLLADPIIKAPGSLSEHDDKDILLKMMFNIRDEIEEIRSLNKKKSLRNDQSYIEEIRKKTKSVIKNIMKRDIGKLPLIDVHLEII